MSLPGWMPSPPLPPDMVALTQHHATEIKCRYVQVIAAGTCDITARR